MHPNQILGTNSEYNQQRVNWIPLNDNQLEEFDSFVCSQEQMQDYLKEKKFKQRNSEISYRILNHWEKLGLIDNDRPQGKGWRKFSVIDIVWMEIIKELRNFGYSNDKILTVKRDLINRAESGIISKNILFIYYVAMAICKKQAIFALVFSNGEIDFATVQEAAAAYSLGVAGNHIRINLNELIQKIYKRDLTPINTMLFQLSPTEFDVIKELRTKGKKNISIRSNDKKIEKIDTEMIFGKDVDIHELLSKDENQDLLIKKNKGKVVYAKKVTSKKYTD